MMIALLIVGSLTLVTLVLVNDWMRRRDCDRRYRFGIAIWMLIGFLTVWFQGAVGIIGDTDNVANLAFIAIPLMALAQALLPRFERQPMATISRWLAVASLTVVVIELAIQSGADGPIWPADVIGVGSVFAAGWWLAAYCFDPPTNTETSRASR